MKLLSSSRLQEILSGFNSIKPILVLGDVGVDKYTLGSVSRISPEAPVPVVEVSKEWFKLGLAANVSDNLKSLNVQNTLCGVIGDDKRGNYFEELLEERGLKTWGIVRSETRETTYKERVTTNIQQICRIDYETKHDIDAETLDRLLRRLHDFNLGHSALIFEDYGKGLASKKLCETIFKSFNEAGRLVAVDPSRRTPPEWYMGCDLLKPNLMEAYIMAEHLGCRDKDLNSIASILVDKLKLKKLIITLGAQGMGIIDTENGGELQQIKTVANEVFDVSGAGDTAISAIVASLASGATLMEAAWVGNCAAGVVVAKKGTASLTQDELRDFHQELSQNLSDDE